MKYFACACALLAVLGAAWAGHVRSGWSPYAYSSPAVYSRPVLYSPSYYASYGGYKGYPSYGGYGGYGGWSSGWKSGWW